MATETGVDADAVRGTDRLWTGDTRRALLGSVGLVGFVALWWLGSLTQPTYVLPSPATVATTFVAELQRGAVATALGNSLRHWIPGAVVGTVTGIGAGVALGWSGRLDDLTAPVVRLLRPVPPLAVTGFAIAWFGINHAGAAFIIAIGSFWINFYSAYGGVEGVSSDRIDVARSLGVDRPLTMIRTVIVPASLPEITTGIRTAIGRSWMLVVAAEIFGVPGVGRRILRASNNLQVDVVITYILVLSLTYLVVDGAFRLAQGRVLAWR